MDNYQDYKKNDVPLETQQTRVLWVMAFIVFMIIVHV